MTEDDAKGIALKETEYCYVLATAWEGAEKESVCLERIFVKGGCEEIRLAWWNNGNQTMRPADIEAVNWVSLFSKALACGVFNAAEQLGMVKALLQSSVKT